MEIAKRHNIGRESVNKANEKGPMITRREHRIGGRFSNTSKRFRDKTIQRRRKGLGGRIWCKDEKGNLMYEAEEGNQYAKT